MKAIFCFFILCIIYESQGATNIPNYLVKQTVAACQAETKQTLEITMTRARNSFMDYDLQQDAKSVQSGWTQDKSDGSTGKTIKYYKFTELESKTVNSDFDPVPFAPFVTQTIEESKGAIDQEVNLVLNSRDFYSSWCNGKKTALVKQEAKSSGQFRQTVRLYFICPEGTKSQPSISVYQSEGGEKQTVKAYLTYAPPQSYQFNGGITIGGGIYKK